MYTMKGFKSGRAPFQRHNWASLHCTVQEVDRGRFLLLLLSVLLGRFTGAEEVRVGPEGGSDILS